MSLRTARFYRRTAHYTSCSILMNGSYSYFSHALHHTLKPFVVVRKVITSVHTVHTYIGSVLQIPRTLAEPMVSHPCIIL
jgi:hypothetical protein